MGSSCYFCCERERVSYFNYYCADCAMLRRLLMSYSPKKCCEILKKTCLRDDKQIEYKITQEIKKIVHKEIETKNNDDSHIEPPKTRSKKKDYN